MKKERAKYGTVVGVRLPRDLDQRVRYAATMTGQSVSDIIRNGLARVWGMEQAPQELMEGR